MDRRGGTPVLAGLTAALLVAGLCSAVVVGRRAGPVALTVALPSAGLSAGLALEEGPGTTEPPSPPVPASTGATGRDLAAYAGLGAWVDAFDYAPAYHRPREGPQLVPEDLDAMAARGVRTLFLQAARLDDRSPEGIVDAVLVGRFLRRAHERGMRVVGWYLPKFGDLEADLANLRRVRDLRSEGHRFDGIAVDVEWRRDVPDHAERNRRLVELSRRLRQEADGHALGAIVYPPALLEDVRPRFWPGFPWRELAASYDVWLPMAYWTEVPEDSGYRHAGHRYGQEGVERLRANLGDASAAVHVVGGVADVATVGELEGFVRAAHETGAVGWSVYDYRTTSPSSWEALRRPSGRG